jgi:hypothetical protein
MMIGKSNGNGTENMGRVGQHHKTNLSGIRKNKGVK